MTYKEFLKRGNVNEIVAAILDHSRLSCDIGTRGFRRKLFGMH